MVVWAGIENSNGKFSSESNHPVTVLLDWDCRFLDCPMFVADLLTVAEIRRGPVWTAGDEVWARVRRIGEPTCHWETLDWQDANDWEQSGYQALHKFSLEILSTHSAAEMYAFEDHYCSHTDPTKQWDSNDGYDPIDDSEMPELYPGIDPNEYSFLSWDSQNGVWWVQSPTIGTLGSLWVDTDLENPVYWVSRIGKYWDTFTGDWLLYDEGTIYSGDSFLSAIFYCLTLI